MRKRWIVGFCAVLVIAPGAIWYGLTRLDFDIPCQDGTWSEAQQTCIPASSLIVGWMCTVRWITV
jgi:hypothetical protein